MKDQERAEEARGGEEPWKTNYGETKVVDPYPSGVRQGTVAGTSRNGGSRSVGKGAPGPTGKGWVWVNTVKSQRSRLGARIVRKIDAGAERTIKVKAC